VGIDLLLAGKESGFPALFELFELGIKNLALVGVMILTAAMQLAAERRFCFLLGRRFR
jgi:hypothetical protein